MLSTDDEEIADYGRGLGLAVPYLRPSEIANETAPMLPVIAHAIGWVEDHEHLDVEMVVLLQPTSPLRTADHIDACIDLLRDRKNAETVVSVTEVPHRFHPQKVLIETPDGLQPYMHDDRVGQQNGFPVVGRNGPAVLATRTKVIRRGELYGRPCLPYHMPADSSVDIDVQFDLEIAEFLLSRRRTRE